jgi:hypothetical protein
MSLLPFASASGAAPRAFNNLAERARDVAGTPAPRAVEHAGTDREDARGHAPAAWRSALARAARTTSEPITPEWSQPDGARETRETPPDFTALLALMAVTAARETQAARDTAPLDMAALEPSRAGDATADDVLASDLRPDDVLADDAPEAPIARPVTGAERRAADERDMRPDDRTAPASGAQLADLSARIRREALMTARRVLAEPPRLEGERTPPTDASSWRQEYAIGSTPGDPQRFAAAADRAQRGHLSELLARGDRAAADVRGALDALLDVAGTARGRALAESMRPAFAEAVVRSAADVSTAVRDIEALAPAFRARLDRVIERMRDEHGHDVQVIETVRSTERQDHLFAQGRTRPGAVVTWTRDSAHLSGEAADVLVDGQWQNPQGWARLHAIAEEEGLHTLGMRDPGHLELRGAGARGEHASHVPVHGAEPGARRSPMRAPGGVAQVADVATVAQVARVAAVPRAGAAGLARAVERTGRDPATPAPSTTDGLSSTASRTASLAPAISAVRQGDTGAGAGPGGDRERPSREQRAAVTLESVSAIGTLSTSATRVLDGGMPRVQLTPGSETAARAEGIAVLREDAPIRPIDALTLQLDTPEGPEQVRISLRGGMVGTQVSTGNAALAERLRLQTADLQDALGRHGLETEAVSVRQTNRVAESEALRMAVADRGDPLRASGAQAGQQGTFEQGPRDRASARPDRDARQGAGDDSTSERRRDDRQEQR